MRRIGSAVLARLLGTGPLLGALIACASIFRGALSGGGVAAAWQVLAARPILGLVVCEALYLVLLTWHWLRYRPFEPPARGEEPMLSVVIPAFNEGPMVERSIRSVAAADYPRARLEIIVVDDGSRDDTFFHMEKLRREFPELVRLIRFPGNQGKRAGLRAGFEAARGELVLTIDSDSQIDPGTLRAMVAPFADERIGGVAGRVVVLNRDSVIGRMLDVQFTLSFDFLRAAQAHFGTVFVCPGALSAFRRSILLPHLEEWMNQRFLGRPVGHGEDQALTNIVLRAGKATYYQREGIVRTLVPERYRQLCKMLLRWDRSFIVEGFSFARFMFRPAERRNRASAIVAFVMMYLRLAFFFATLGSFPALLVRQPGSLVQVVIAGVLMAGSASLYYLRTERSLRFLWGVAYAFFSLVALQWILPWALITVRDERWGTR
jgi:hyaluronan synthase